MGDILSYAGPFIVRTFDWGEGQAAHDRQLAEGLPGIWSALWSVLPLNGGGEIQVTLDGVWPSEPGRLIEALGIRLEGAGVVGHEEDGLTGSLDLTRVDEGTWRVEGATDAGTLRGFGLEATRWSLCLLEGAV